MGNYGHLAYEKQQEMLWELRKIEIGLGTLVNTNQRLEQAIKPHVEELSEWVKTEQPSIHVDETPWPVKGVKEWLWVFTNQEMKDLNIIVSGQKTKNGLFMISGRLDLNTK
ncbi:MAG: transposase [Okeania sp. SIO2C2]|nr:transposase [Okeania sp. SIO2C2]